MVLVELWREEILPLLLQTTTLSNSFTLYTILFHEATCVTLLETVLFHPDSAQTLDHDALDLIDYAQRAISNKFLNRYPNNFQQQMRFGTANLSSF